jgi:hypothetical protein
MKTKSCLFFTVAVVACVLVVSWFSAPIQGNEGTKEKSYEIQTLFGTEYRTDAARAIDAYERLMDRYMGMTESVFVSIDTDVRDVARQLDSMNSRLTELLMRIERIEKALGIEQNAPPADSKHPHPADKSGKHQ